MKMRVLGQQPVMRLLDKKKTQKEVHIDFMRFDKMDLEHW